MAGRLAGKGAFITGGGTGIGRATALRFAREGARVAVVGRHRDTLEATVRELEAQGGEGLVAAADVTDEAEVRMALEQTCERFGGLDVLVLNAGWEGPMRPLPEVSVDEWDRLMAVNVRGLFLCAKYAIAPLTARGGGSIVVVASDSALVAAPGAVPYCTSKGAALMFCKALAVDLRPDRIRVNCICPSNVDTAMLRRAVGAGDEDDLGALGFELEYVAPPELLAAQILFLASDEAASITGTALVADYGGTAHTTWKI